MYLRFSSAALAAAAAVALSFGMADGALAARGDGGGGT